MKKFLAAVLFLATGAAIAGPTDLIKNGNFEQNGVSNGTWTTRNALDGWTVGKDGVEVRNNVAGAAKFGNNYLELDTNTNSWISQDIKTIAGAQYDLAFYYAAREQTKANTNGIDVYWNDKLVKQVALDNPTSVTNWIRIDLSMFAVGNLSTLKFEASGISDSLGGSLDNVSMTAHVPEPGTLASMLLGLGMLGFTLRRRQQ